TRARDVVLIEAQVGLGAPHVEVVVAYELLSASVFCEEPRNPGNDKKVNCLGSTSFWLEEGVAGMPPATTGLTGRVSRVRYRFFPSTLNFSGFARKRSTGIHRASSGSFSFLFKECFLFFRHVDLRKSASAGYPQYFSIRVCRLRSAFERLCA